MREVWRNVWKSHDQITAFVAVIAVIGATIGYFAARREFRVREALVYIQRSHEGSVGEAERALARFWISQQGLTLWSKARSPTFQEQVAQEVAATGLEEHLDALQAFYREVAICSREGACDDRTTCAFFFHDMMAFGNTYGGYLDRWSARWGEDMYAEVREYLKSTCEDQWRDYFRGSTANGKSGS